MLPTSFSSLLLWLWRHVVNGLFWIYCNDHVISMFESCDRKLLFMYVETSLPLCNGANLILMNDLFVVIWNWVCQYFIENFCISVNQEECYIHFFLKMCPYGFGNSIILTSLNSLKEFIHFLFHGIIWVTWC